MSDLFGPSSLPPIDPFFGRRPGVGDRVAIDFGDSINAHPEVTGIVHYISDEFISVGEKRFRIDQCVHIEVLDD